MVLFLGVYLLRKPYSTEQIGYADVWADEIPIGFIYVGY